MPSEKARELSTSVYNLVQRSRYVDGAVDEPADAVDAAVAPLLDALGESVEAIQWWHAELESNVELRNDIVQWKALLKSWGRA